MPAERDDDRSQHDRSQCERGQGTKDEHGEQGNRSGRVGTTSVDTSDPAVISPDVMQGSPEQVVSFQTSQLPSPPPDDRFASGGDVVKEQRQQRQGGKKGEHGKNGDQKGEQKGGDKQNGGQGQQDRQRASKQESQGDGKRDRNQDDERHRDEERRRKKKKQVQQAAGEVSWKTVVLAAVLALVCGVGGAWGYSAIFGSSDKGKSSDKSDKGSGKSDKSGGKSGGKGEGKSDKGGGKSNSGSSEGGASASEIPGFNSAKDADTFKKELEHLAHRLDLLGARIDRMTTNKEETPPVLHTVQRKVTDLEREVDDVARLPSQFSRLERKVDDLKQEFRTLKEQASGTELPIASELTPPKDDYKAAPLGETPADPANEATLKLAGGLLREGHHSQAYEVLRRLQRERPNDARVWYLSALANGLATGKWDGKTKELAKRGLECEREGHPSSSEIDHALAGVSSAFGNDWLASQRSNVKTR